jgi:hypothetical protein
MSNHYKHSRPKRGHLRRLQSSICARTYRSIFCELAVVISVVGFVSVAPAAEITMMGPWVALEGQIEPGDYDKLRDDLIVKRDYGDDPRCSAIYEDGCPDTIYLSSPGGDVAEAMKIGRLVRTLGWTALVPARKFNSPAGSSNHETEIKRYNLVIPKITLCAQARVSLFSLVEFIKTRHSRAFLPYLAYTGLI